MTQIIAIDWSGRATGAAEHIWTAIAEDRRLVSLENGLERSEVIAQVIEAAQREKQTVVGLDFAFSFPAWYCERQGWRSGLEVWRAMHSDAEVLLGSCEPPFWGRAGTVAQQLGSALRVTDSAVGGTPKSVFQIGGAGAVGTGSLRGMEYLAELAEAGFSIWPFDDAGWPLAIEIYPRLFTPGLIKNRHRERRRWLSKRFPHEDRDLIERAAGSEDALDAAVSALVMAEHVNAIENLPRLAPGAPERLEGAIWSPPEDFGDSDLS